MFHYLKNSVLHWCRCVHITRNSYYFYILILFVSLKNSLLAFKILILVLQIEDAAGHINLGEREYVVSPQFGALTMSAHHPNKGVDRRVSEAKKPFDWMTDEQFHCLQLLAQNYDWFLDMFERLVIKMLSFFVGL